MDLISSLKSEILRPLLLLVIPGLTAIGPHTLVLAHLNVEIERLFNTQPLAFFGLFLCAVLAAGMILENFASRLECEIDHTVEDDTHIHNKLWAAYLQLETSDEVVGQRYLRTIVTRLKFESSMVFALPTGAVGLAALNWVGSHWDWIPFSVFAALPVLLAYVMLQEAYLSVTVAARTRATIIKAKGGQATFDHPRRPTWRIVSVVMKALVRSQRPPLK